MKTSKVKVIAACCFIGAVAGCATTSDKILKPDTDGTNVALRAGVSQSSVIGQRATKVTVTRKSKTLTDIPCVLDGTEFVANFTAPATVNIPSFGQGVSKPVRLTCTVDGAQVQQTYAAVNLSAKARRDNAVAAGALISPIMGAAMAADAAKAKPEDAYGYRDIELKL